MQKMEICGFHFRLSSGIMGENEDPEMLLPEARRKGNISLEETLNSRRSWKDFQPYTLSLQEISQLFWAGYGLRGGQKRSRTTPSAGGLRPLALYAVLPGSGDGASISHSTPGFVRYLPLVNEIEQLNPKELLEQVAEASARQMWMAKAAGLFLITVNYEPCIARYGERGKRYALLEAGSSGQNLCLQATALGLESRAVGAFKDRTLQRLLGLPKEHEIVLIIAVGFYEGTK
jgi:SagB-type dehydrogenase family enzyme